MFASILVTVVLLIHLIVFLYLYLTRNFDYWRNKGVASVPNPKPGAGNLLDVFLYRRAAADVFKDMYFWNKDAPFVGFYIVDKPALLLRDPQFIRDVFVKDFSKFNSRNITVSSKQDPIGGNFLFVMTNPEWKYSRCKMSPLFSSAKIKAMLPLIEEAGNDLVTYMEQAVVQQDSVDSREMCAKFMTDIIISCAFGLRAESFDKENPTLFREIGRRLMAPAIVQSIKQNLFFLSPGIADFFGSTFFDRLSYQQLGSQFWRVFEERKASGGFRNDLVDIFIKSENDFGDDNGMKFDRNWIVGQAFMFFVAGFETSAGSLSFSLYELSFNREVQEKLRKEIVDKFPPGTKVTLEGIDEMKYLNMVIAEALRKYPVLHFLDRKCKEDYTLEGTDVVIEKGTSVFLPLFGLHNDPKYFPEPNKYDPERFNNENGEKVTPYIYNPFGTGPRDCIGKRLGFLNVAYGLIRILREFEVMVTKDTPTSISINPKQVTVNSIGGLPLKFKKL